MRLDACALALARGERQLFADITFSLAPGGALRVMGANGSGKTSLLRVLAGLTRPDHGSVHWNGAPMADGPGAASLLYLGHAEAVKHDLLAWENLAYGPLLGVPHAKDLALQALAAAGLAAQARLPARVLSQGQRKRVAQARLHLAAATPLWILDEPFSSLDAEAAGRLGAVLAAHCASGGMLVYTCHQDHVLAGAAILTLGDAGARPC